MKAFVYTYEETLQKGLFSRVYNFQTQGNLLIYRFIFKTNVKIKEVYEMISPDTIKLLRECDAGIKMGVSSIDEVLGYVHAAKMKKILIECKEEHNAIKQEIQKLLDEYHDDGKDPNPIAKSMSWIKTNVKLIVDESDNTIAELMTDGCNMGVKSLNKYLNEYKAADDRAKDKTKRLIELEKKLCEQMQPFL